MKKITKGLSLIIVVVLMFSMLGACNNAKPETQKEPTVQQEADSTTTDAKTDKDKPVEGAKAFKNIAVVCSGPRGDSGIVDMICASMEAIEAEHGINLRIVELGSQGTERAKVEESLMDICEREDWDFIITSGGIMVEVVEGISEQYPNQRFMIFDSEYNFESYPRDNVYSASFKQNESAYLAGILAMSMSEKQKIGFVGGVTGPIINDFMVGYIQGAQSVNPESKVLISFTEDWYDTSKAKELGLTLIGEGADVIFPAAGPASDGVMEAGAEKDTYLIGVDNDRYYYYENKPEIRAKVISSVLKRVDVSATRAADKWLDGTLVFGEHEYLGIKEGGVGLADNPNFQSMVSDAIRETILKAETEVAEGKIVVQSALGMDTDEIDAIKASVS